MRRNFMPDGQLHVIPSTYPLSLRADPAPAAIEIPKDLDQKVVEHIRSTAVEEYKKTSAPKVPEKYTIKLPDDAVIPKGVLDKVAAKSRELGLTKDEHAQAIIDLINEEASGIVNRTLTEHSNQVKNWEEEALKAPDLGNGKPEHLQAHVARVKRLLGKFFPAGAVKLIDLHGIGSHPDFLRGLSKLADAANEDKIELGSIGGGRSGSAASRIYPSQGKVSK